MHVSADIRLDGERIPVRIVRIEPNIFRLKVIIQRHSLMKEPNPPNYDIIERAIECNPNCTSARFARWRNSETRNDILTTPVK